MSDQLVTPPAPEAAPDPTPAATPAAPTPPSPASPWTGSPWAEKLDGLQDGLSRQQVHELWQSEVQPYVTRKEQELGEVSTIWNQLNDEDQSVPTFLALAERQYGPEVAQHLAESLGAYVDQQEGDPGAAGDPNWDTDEAYQQWFDAQPPWVQAQEEQRLGAEQDAEYDRDIQQYAADVLTDGTKHILDRYVVATEGDVAQAKALYDQEFGPVVAAAKADPAFAQQVGLGHLHGQAAPAAPAAPAGAPNVLGASGAAGGMEPPTEPKYATLDQAMDDLFAAVSGTGPHLQQ